MLRVYALTLEEIDFEEFLAQV
jgi:hypothetical protein